MCSVNSAQDKGKNKHNNLEKITRSRRSFFFSTSDHEPKGISAHDRVSQFVFRV